MDLFEIELALPSLDVLVGQAKSAIADLMKKEHPVVVAWSSGKDSSVTLALVLEVAREFRAMGRSAKVVVTTSDTLVESPEIARHIKVEMRKIQRYAKKHQLDVECHIAKPNLMATWQMKVLSGRGLPSYAGNNSDCSMDLKITPQRALRKRLFARFKEQGLPDPVTCLGTRFLVPSTVFIN
ncbi:hypothetical protein [Azonexus hydrophilus]|uniref:Phosphoadenosine phosphosulphate reductase domain-containing protein n=1 Tax=Azonexus hydrophilus TaxID=418702 RepID=A0ABZ2XLK9_9RHOO